MRTIVLLKLICLQTSLAWAQEEGIRDVKGPTQYPVETIWIVLSVIVSSLILIAVSLAIYKKYQAMVRQKNEITLTPAELAKKQLKELKAKDNIDEQKYYVYYAELSDILRLYLENQFKIRAPEMTTEEFLVSIKDNELLSDGHKKILKNFLEYSDIVKFAKHSPTVNEVDDGYELAIKFIQQTEKIEE